MQTRAVAGGHDTACVSSVDTNHCRFFLTSDGSIYRDWGLFDYVAHDDKRVQPYAECTAAAIAAPAATATAPAAAGPAAAATAASTPAATAAGSTGAAQCPVHLLKVSATRGIDPMPLKVTAKFSNLPSKTIPLTAHEATTIKELKLVISDRWGEDPGCQVRKCRSDLM